MSDIDHANQLRAFAERLERGESPHMILEVRGLRSAAKEIERLEAEIERLQGEVKALQEMIGEIDRQHATEIERLRASMARIGRMSAPGTRTLDDFIRDMTWINDECRLEQARKG